LQFTAWQTAGLPERVNNVPWPKAGLELDFVCMSEIVAKIAVAIDKAIFFCCIIRKIDNDRKGFCCS